MRRGGRAFTLIEVMLAITLLGLVAITGVLGMRATQVNKQSKAAAEILAEGLRLANLRARSQGVPVAVGLPTSVGHTPVARGYYYAAGEAAPRHTRGYDFGAELPDAYLFAGTYAGPAWTPPLATASRGSQFSFDEWVPPFPFDAYLVFLPSGEVVANHSAADGGYRIVVGSRMSYDQAVPSANPDLPPEANLTHVSDPYTVTISTQGQVDVVPGLLGASAGLVTSSRSLGRPEPVAFTPSQYRGPNRPPVLKDPKLVIDPPPDRKTIAIVTPSNPAITVLPNGKVKLTFFAFDEDGDQLTAQWISARIKPHAPKANPGSWSVPVTRMRWDFGKKAWYRSSIWSAPEDAEPGFQYRLNCTIRDGRGGILKPSAQTALGYPGATGDGIDVGVLSQVRLVYNAGTNGLKAAVFDGTAPSSILDSGTLQAGSPAHMSWSVDRGGLVYHSGKKPLFLASLDRSPPSSVGNNTEFVGDKLTGLVIARDKLYGLVTIGSEVRVQSMSAPPVAANLTVTNVTAALVNTPAKFDGLLASHDRSTLVSTDGKGKFLFVYLKAEPPVTEIKDGPIMNSVCLNPETDQLVGLNEVGAITLCDLTVDGEKNSARFGSPTVLETGDGCSNPSISPNGNFLVYKSATGEVTLRNLGEHKESVLSGLNDSLEMVWSQE